MRLLISLTLLLIVSVVKGQNICYVSLQGVDTSACGNGTTVDCATIAQCLKNYPGPIVNGSSTGSSVQIQIAPGIYSGKGFCNLTVAGLVSISAKYINQTPNITIDCGKQSRHFELKSANFSSAITLNGISFANGTSDNGGSLYIHNSTESNFQVSIANCLFINNTATTSGGAIYSEATSNTIQIKYTNFLWNNAQYGGAVYTNSPFASEWCMFQYNTATDGGAIFSQSNQFSSLLSISDTLFSGNQAENMGGAIYMESNYFNQYAVNIFRGAVIVHNNASKGGGFAIGGETYVNYFFDNSTIAANTAQKGGAAWIQSRNTYRGNLPWIYNKISENSAVEGGGLYIDFANDTDADSFDLRYVTLQFNSPNNLQCSDPSVPFCQACYVYSCRNCPATCSVPYDSLTHFCHTPQNNITCGNGTCAFSGYNQELECQCNFGYYGDACEFKFHYSGDEWIYVLGTIAVVIVAVVVFLIGRRIYKRRSHEHHYAPIQT